MKQSALPLLLSGVLVGLAAPAQGEPPALPEGSGARGMLSIGIVDPHAAPVQLPPASQGSNIEAWTEGNIEELTRLLQASFGNRIYDLRFEHEPHPHLIVELAGEAPVPSGLHAFGPYRVDVRFHTGATVRRGEMVDGLWERWPRQMQPVPGAVEPVPAAVPMNPPAMPEGDWHEPVEPDTAQLGRRIRAEYAARLAGMWFDRNPFRLVVRLTGDEPVPSELVKIGQFTVEVHYRTSAPHSLAELRAAFDRRDVIERFLPDGYGGFADERTGHLRLTVALGNEPASGTEAALSEALGVPVRITAEEVAVIQPALK